MAATPVSTPPPAAGEGGRSENAAEERRLELHLELEEEHESLYGALRQRFLALWRGGGRLRLMTLLAIAVLVAATAAAFAVDIPMPKQPINSSHDSLVVIGTPLLVVCLALFALAWAYMLTAVAHARWPVHLLGMLAFTAAFAEPAVSLLGIRPLFAYGMFAILALTWIAGWSRRLLRRDRGLGLVLPAIFTLLVGAFFALGWAAAALTGSLILFGFSISLQMGSLAFFLVPVVFMSGSDFAEWGDVAGDWVRRQADRIRGRERVALSAAAVVVAIAIFVRDAVDYGRAAVPELIVALAAAGLLVLFVRATRLLHHSFPVRIPILALLVASFAYMLIFIGSYLALGMQSQGARSPTSGSFILKQYSRTEEPAFHVLVPSLWEAKVSTSNGGGWFSWLGNSSADPGQFSVVVVGGDETGRDAFADWVSACCPGQSTVDGEPVADGPWVRRSVALETPGGPMTGTAWQQQRDGKLYLLYGISSRGFSTLNDPLFADLVKSFDLGAAPPAPAHDTSGGTRALETVSAIPWVAVIVVTALLFGFRRRLRPGLGVGLLFLSLVGLFYVAAQVDNIAAFLRIPTGHAPFQLVGLRLEGVQMVAALATVAAVAWLAVRHRLQRGMELVAFLLILDVALLLVAGLFWVFGAKQQYESVIVAQTVLVTLALTWDIVMSGGAIAGGHGRWFPRQTRVLLYFGYDMLVAAAVLFFSGFTDASTGERVPNDSLPTDFWVQSGLVELGMPMLVLLLLLKLGRRARGGAHAEAPAARA